MNITILCIGKLKERYWSEAVVEYEKRLSKYCTLQIEELKESRLPNNATAADEEIVKTEEGKNILARIKKEAYVISLEIAGNQLSSERLSEKLDNLGVMGKSQVVFIIGGSLGLSEEVSKRADFKLSFSRMTFPHQMMRVILLEQIYRSFKISKNEMYHK